MSLSLTFNVIKFVKLVNSTGMDPVNLFESTFKTVNFSRSPNSDGMPPSKSLFESDKFSMITSETSGKLTGKRQ